MPWLHSFLLTWSLMTSLLVSSSSSSVLAPVSIFMCFCTKALTMRTALGTRFFRGAIHARLRGIVYILSSTISSSGISSRFFSSFSASSSSAFSSSSGAASAGAFSVSSFVSSMVSSVSASSVPSASSASSVVSSDISSVSVSSMDSSPVSSASSVGCSFSFRLLSSVVSSASFLGWF